MKLQRRFGAGALLVAVGVALAVVGTSIVGASTDAPLSDEDIVRGFVSGRSEAQLIEWIAESDVDFDLSGDMLQELRAAGLPEAVIEAMQQRQAAMNEANRPAGVEVPGAATEPGSLSVLLNPKQDADAEDRGDKTNRRDKRAGKEEGEPGLRFLDVVPAPLAESLSLGADDRRFTDAAIFLGCTNTRHVPDHWRSKTPLGRDFVNAPRHRLLAWVSGAHELDRKRLGKFLGKFLASKELAEARILELDIPERIEGILAETTGPDDGHDLILGVALQAGGRFYVISADILEDVQIDGSGELSATLRSGTSPLAPEVDVRFKR